MAATLVCTAGMEYRSKCDTGCSHCGYIQADRRQRFDAVIRDIGERRFRSNWIPAGHPIAATVGDAARLQDTGRRTPWTLASALVILLIIFNFLDSILTMRALSMGIEEANPVMAGLFNVSTPAAVLTKSVIVGVGALALWRISHVALAFKGLAVVAACYGGVVAYHLFFQVTL